MSLSLHAAAVAFWCCYERGLPIPAPVREALGDAVKVSAPGIRGRRRLLALARRNAALIDAAALVASDPACSVWTRCTRLAELLDRLPRSRDRFATAPGADWSALRVALWTAWREASAGGLTLPATPEGLYAIVIAAQDFGDPDDLA